jgi:hypothetical protein
MDDRADGTRSISWWLLLCLGIASVVLMAVLAFVPTTVHQIVDDDDHPGYTTVCSSVVAAGWPRDLGTGDDRIVARGILSTDTSEPPYEICQTRRSLFVAGMAVLAVPASSLIYLAASRPRRPRHTAEATRDMPASDTSQT